MRPFAPARTGGVVHLRVLALATSGPRGELAVRTKDGRTTVRRLTSNRTRGREVAPTIRDLLASEGLAPGDLDGFAIDIGPGSFTGVRVGVATVKTLAWTLDRPVVAVTSLEILAEASGRAGAVLALRDAGRGTVYAQRFEAGVPVTQPLRVDGAELQGLAEGATVVGEDAPALAASLGLERDAVDVTADATTLLALALPGLASGQTTPPHLLAPRYLQASAPEERRQGLRSD